MNFEIKYGNLSFTVSGQYEDCSFDHEFGTQQQGYWALKDVFLGQDDVTEVLSQDVLEFLEDELNARAEP